jgi:hypothetical protein
MEDPSPDRVKFSRIMYVEEVPTEDDDIAQRVEVPGNWVWRRETVDGGLVVQSPPFETLAQALLNAQRTFGHPFIYEETEYA